ncbi:type II toxin-antitoxin system RelE/ParE family toxin [Pseudorhodoplanes sp.]|uniref:type II toxin-antitoxin system RelE/ParE family toxin n=1 Tax=Pseudorhodoplanes sp. TaxID=1934341 RepID=UPI003D0DCC63
MRLRFTAPAIRHFTSIAEYISRDDPSASLKVGQRIRAACELLTVFPSIGRHGTRAGTRELSLRGLPYVIVHRVTEDEIVILAIYHVRQLRPGQHSPKS